MIQKSNLRLKLFSLVILVLLFTIASSQLSVAKTPSFNPLPEIIYVLPGQSLSYQVHTELNATAYWLEGSSDFAISSSGLLSNTSILVSGDEKSFILHANQTDGKQNYTSQVNVTVMVVSASSQSKSSKEWLSEGRVFSKSRTLDMSPFFDSMNLKKKVSTSSNVFGMVADKDSLYVLTTLQPPKSSYFILEKINKQTRKQVYYLRPDDLSSSAKFVVAEKSLVVFYTDSKLNQHIYVYNVENGNIIWKKDFGTKSLNLLSVVDGRIFLVQKTGILSVFTYDLNTGAELSHVSKESSSVTDDLIIKSNSDYLLSTYISKDKQNYVYLLDLKLNKIYDEKIKIISKSIYQDLFTDKVYLLSSLNEIYELDVQTGKISFKQKLDKDFQIFAIADDVVYAFSGKLIIARSILGDKLWDKLELTLQNLNSFIVTKEGVLLLAKSLSDSHIHFMSVNLDGDVLFDEDSGVSKNEPYMLYADDIFVTNPSKTGLNVIGLSLYTEVQSSKKSSDTFSASVIIGCTEVPSTIVVSDDDTGYPVEGVLVKASSEIGSFSCLTSEDGVCDLILPKGDYSLVISESSYDNELTKEIRIDKCSASSSLTDEERNQRVQEILEDFSKVGEVGSEEISKSETGSVLNSFNSEGFSEGEEDVDAPEISKKVTVLNFKSGSAFSIFVLLLVLLLVIIVAYVRHHMTYAKQELHSIEERLEEKFNKSSDKKK